METGARCCRRSRYIEETAAT
jgi:hypothetical protein